MLLSERIPWDSSSMRAMTEESAADGGGGGGGGGGSAAAAAVATTTSDKLSAEEEEEDQAHVSEIFRVSSLLFSVSPITQHKKKFLTRIFFPCRYSTAN